MMTVTPSLPLSQSHRLQSDRADRCQDSRRRFPFVAEGAASSRLLLLSNGAVATRAITRLSLRQNAATVGRRPRSHGRRRFCIPIEASPAVPIEKSSGNPQLFVCAKRAEVHPPGRRHHRHRQHHARGQRELHVLAHERHRLPAGWAGMARPDRRGHRSGAIDARRRCHRPRDIRRAARSHRPSGRRIAHVACTPGAQRR